MRRLFKRVKEEKKTRGEDFPSLSIALFDEGVFFELLTSEKRALLQEAIYLLRDYDENAEQKLMANVEEWHEELFVE